MILQAALVTKKFIRKREITLLTLFLLLRHNCITCSLVLAVPINYNWLELVYNVYYVTNISSLRLLPINKFRPFIYKKEKNITGMIKFQ